MSKLRVHISMSVDGYSAGPDQSIDNPMGEGGLAIFEWAFATRTFRAMHGPGGGATGIDEDHAAAGFANVGAWIMGRNMFGPVRGPWPDENWKGWWGETPPYHVPAFVLTRYAREPIPMQGGTTFHFVTDGIDKALALAKDAANGKDVRLGGGVSTIRQYLAAGLVDELNIALAPTLLGRGELLLAGLDLPKLGYACTGAVAGELATHLVLKKTSAG